MTVAELQRRMSWREFQEWRAWLRIRHGAPKTDDEMLQAILERRATAHVDALART